MSVRQVGIMIQPPSRQRAGRPQLKRGSLGSHSDMSADRSHRWSIFVLGAAAALSHCGCTPRRPSVPARLLGVWRSAGSQDTATLHFLEDGTLTIAVTNPQVDYSFSATWQPIDSNHIRVKPQAGLPDVVLPKSVELRITLAGDRLTLTGSAGDAVTYLKVQ